MSAKFLASAVILLGAVTVWVPGVARAQSSNKGAAEALFREARKLVDQGNYTEACEKLAASERLDPAVGTLLNLAHCYEKQGRTATAWATYREAVGAAKLAGQVDREKTARRAADALEPTLPRLTIVVSPGAKAADVQVTRDGVAIPSDLFGTDVPVDPGDHVIAASAAGRKPWSTNVSVAAGAPRSVTVPDLEALPAEPTSSSAPSSDVKGVVATPVFAGPAAPEPGSSWSSQKTFAVIAGGIAVAGAVVAGVELSRFSSEKEQADVKCPRDGCMDPAYTQSETLRQEAANSRTLSIVGAAVGGAALVTGTVLWFTAPKPSPDAGEVSVGAVPTPGGIFCSVRGFL